MTERCARHASLRRPATLLLALPAAMFALAPAAVAQDVSPQTTPAASAVPDASRDALGPAVVTTDAAPLSAAAACVAVAGGSVAIGRTDGSVVVCKPPYRTGVHVALPGAGGPVRAVTSGGDAVWWLGGDSVLYCVSLPDGRAIRTVVSGLDRGACRLAVFRDVVWLFGSAGLRTFDAATAAPIDPQRLLLADCGADAAVSIWPAADGLSATLLASQPARGGGVCASAWRSVGRDGWYPTVVSHVFASDAEPGAASIAASGGRVASADGGWLEVVDEKDGAGRTVTVPGGDLIAGVPGTAALAGSSLWWLQSGAVFRTDLATGRAEAYLPWNVPGMRVEGLACDAGGAWIATTQGVRRIADGVQPSSDTGFDGFVRAPLDRGAADPPTQAADGLADAVSGWLGVPYLYGGASQAGTDCSGFVMSAFAAVGIALPHGSANLRDDPDGATVRDELRYGDVLVYPGHAAIYLGDGITAETVSGQNAVSISTLWRRHEAVVRRFLDVPVERAALTSRHMAAPRQSRAHARRQRRSRAQRPD